MSKKGWLAEFYPITAEEAAKGNDLAAVEHSLTKWKGLTKKNLSKHRAKPTGMGDLQSQRAGSRWAILIDSRTCALCEKHYDRGAAEACKTCPLAKSRDGMSCDRMLPHETKSPWSMWTMHYDPSAMIHALEHARAELIRGNIK